MTDAHGAERRYVRVLEVSLPTPRTVRVVARGELADWPEPGPAANLELFIPDTVAGPVARTYTVRDWNRDRAEVTFDMCMHDGQGLAGMWASRVVPGMWLEVAASTRSTFAPSPTGGRYILAGDETAVPAIVTCVASLAPGASATVILEVSDVAERQPLETLAAVEAHWLLRDGDPPDLIGAVLAAAAETPVDLIWVAAEAQVIATIREQLGAAADRSSPALATFAYWKRRTADYREAD